MKKTGESDFIYHVHLSDQVNTLTGEKTMLESELNRLKDSIQNLRKEVGRAVKIINSDHGNYHKGMQILCAVAGLKVPPDLKDLKVVDVRDVVKSPVRKFKGKA